MDTVFELNGITFRWRKLKLTKNEIKHQVSIEQAAQAYFDPFARFVDASRRDEAREAYIGRDGSLNLLFVVHIEQADDDIRIISARPATAEEERFYDEQF